jgi:proliferating cell nuclear antigen
MNIEIHNNTNAEVFSSIFQHVKSFTDQINITFEKDKMYIQSMDSSHITIFEVNLNSTWFDVYNFDESNEHVIIGIQASTFYKVLNTREKGQNLSIKFLEKDDDKLFISFSGEDKTIFDKNFQLPLIDIEADMLQIPDYDSAVSLTIESSRFASIVNQMQIFADTIQFNCLNDKIQLSSTSGEHGKMEVVIDNSLLESYSPGEDEFSSSFALFKLHDICLYNKISKNVRIQLTPNFPIQIEYLIGEQGKLTFFLAPKIDE